MNTYVIGNYVDSYSAGIDFSRQNLTSTDIRFRRLKSIPTLQGLSYIHELYAAKLSFLYTFFYKFVMLVLLYGSDICVFHLADIENVHLLFCKKILHLKKIPLTTCTTYMVNWEDNYRMLVVN